MTVRWLRGDCRVTLAGLEPGSVQACITSPPYWGLRSYGTPDLVWGGDADCRHIFGLTIPGDNRGGSGSPTAKNNRGEGYARAIPRGSMCPCGAWLGSLGLEPTPELFVEHIAECFRAVRRVLRDDGVLWVNMGDSYAGSGKGPSESLQPLASQLQKVGPQPHSIGTGRSAGFKAKDLMEIPSMVAQALRADGWYLRSRIPWLKRNAMPESVTDRPASSIEYMFLLSKSRTYYWDATAVRHAVGSNTHSRGDGLNPKAIVNPDRANGIKQNGSFSAAINGPVSSRNRRNGDWFFESWQGLLLDEDDGPLALVVNPAPLKIAHYASYPPKLVEPMVKASTRPGDVVLDPFAGAGTTLMVADRLGRNAIGCELSESYSDMGTDRIVGDAPMFTEIVA